MLEPGEAPTSSHSLNGTGRNLGGARAVVNVTTAVVVTEGTFGQTVTSNRKSTGLLADKAKRAPATTKTGPPHAETFNLRHSPLPPRKPPPTEEPRASTRRGVFGTLETSGEG